MINKNIRPTIFIRAKIKIIIRVTSDLCPVCCHFVILALLLCYV